MKSSTYTINFNERKCGFANYESRKSHHFSTRVKKFIFAHDFSEILKSVFKLLDSVDQLVLVSKPVLTYFSDRKKLKNKNLNSLEGFCATNFKMMGLCESIYEHDGARLEELRLHSGIDAHFAGKFCPATFFDYFDYYPFWMTFMTLMCSLQILTIWVFCIRDNVRLPDRIFPTLISAKRTSFHNNGGAQAGN